MWYQQAKKGIQASVKVTPNSSANQLVGVTGDFLKIKIAAPPEKGRANKELINFLSKTLKLAKEDIVIVRGMNESKKLIFIPIEADKILALLNNVQ